MKERRAFAGRRMTLQLEGESEVSPSQPLSWSSCFELSEQPWLELLLEELDALSSTHPPLERVPSS